MKKEDFKSNKISIMISTHNRVLLLQRMVDSILEQSYRNYEIIIVDDNSSDSTENYAIDLKNKNENVEIIYYRNCENLGVSESKKKGYDLASGDILIFADDDDYYIDKYYFEKLKNIYERNNNCVMTVASTLIYDEKKNSYSNSILNFNDSISTKEYLIGFMSQYSKPASMFSMSLNAEKMKNICYSNLKCFNDTSLYLYGLLADGIVCCIESPVGVYFKQIGSMSSSVSAGYILDNLNSKLDIGKKACERKIINNYDLWLYNQSLPTLMLFWGGKIQKIKDINRINLWILKNINLKFIFRLYRTEIIQIFRKHYYVK